MKKNTLTELCKERFKQKEVLVACSVQGYSGQLIHFGAHYYILGSELNDFNILPEYIETIEQVHAHLAEIEKHYLSGVEYGEQQLLVKVDKIINPNKFK